MKQQMPSKKSKEQASQSLILEQALEVIQELRQQIIDLKAENQKLKDQLSKNSRNSSKPPEVAPQTMHNQLHARNIRTHQNHNQCQESSHPYSGGEIFESKFSKQEIVQLSLQ